MPGLIHYSRVRDEWVATPSRSAHDTHRRSTWGSARHYAFAIDGACRGSERTVLRRPRIRSVCLTIPPAAAVGIREVIDPASVQSTNQFTAGVSYRAGQLAGAIEPTHRGGWMAGGDVGVAAYAPGYAQAADVIKATRVGGFMSFPLTTWMDGDVSAEVYLHTDNSHSAYEGGRISQGVAGVKVGRRAGVSGSSARSARAHSPTAGGSFQAPTWGSRLHIGLRRTAGGIGRSSMWAPSSR